jgi:GGDEF domain-containing protein
MQDGEDGVVDSQTGLPNREGWDAVLQTEEDRSRRHGGVHGLVLIRLASTAAGTGSVAEQAALAIGQSLREIDLLARIDQQTFAVLALHCDDLDRVVARLRLSLAKAGVAVADLVHAPTAGTDLQATWSAMTTGLAVVTPTARHIPFVASSPLSLN